MNFVANPVLNYAKNKLIDSAKNELIDSAKKQLFEQLEEKLKKGDAGINALFFELKEKLKSLTVLQTILGAICVSKQKESVKTELKKRIDEIDFSTELEKMPQISEDIKLKIIALSETLKDNLKNLINALIDCNDAPTTSSEQPPVPVIGGKRNKNTKRKHRKKTKKHYKKSRGRK